jgi:hypothetical protein
VANDPEVLLLNRLFSEEGSEVACPFCGKHQLVPMVTADEGGELHFIMCDFCGARGPDARSAYGAKFKFFHPWDKATIYHHVTAIEFGERRNDLVRRVEFGGEGVALTRAQMMELA